MIFLQRGHGTLWLPSAQLYISIFVLCYRILQLCKDIPKGITDSVIQNDMPECDASQRVMAVNKLLSTVTRASIFPLSDKYSFNMSSLNMLPQW